MQEQVKWYDYVVTHNMGQITGNVHELHILTLSLLNRLQLFLLFVHLCITKTVSISQFVFKYLYIVCLTRLVWSVSDVDLVSIFVLLSLRCPANQTKSPFTLVQLDVWGPGQINSTIGFHYFVMFTDDFSQCTWTFLMKNRFELFSIFQTFYTEIQNQFGVYIDPQ